MDIIGLIRQMMGDGSLNTVVRNPLAQFGRRTRRYLGASLLPERNVPENAYTEDNVRYRSVIANASTRYSPVQLKRGSLVGSMNVVLAESDIGSELTGRDLDGINTYLRRNTSLTAIAQVVRFLDTTINIPLIEWNERARWQAIVSAQVQLRGDNKYTENINYSNPTNHRAVAGGTWSNDAYDPMDDVFAMVQLLADKGFTVGRIISSRQSLSKMAGNAKIAARTNRITVDAAGQISGINGRVSLAQINGMMSSDGLPPIELYDLSYRTSLGTGRFMPADVMVFVATTGRDESLDLADGRVEVLPDTLGYTGIGTPVGQTSPGRVSLLEYFGRKPPRVEAEGWQTSLPVITEPEAVCVITGIA